MKSIILFRYHNSFELVAERIKFIEMLDPDIEVFGIYGGPTENLHEANKKLAHLLYHNYLVPAHDPRWKWLHTDKIYKMWYRTIGHEIPFDRAYVIEWDLMLMEHINDIYPPGNEDTVFCTGLIPLKKVSNYWYWMNNKNVSKVEAFYNEVKKRYNKDFTPYASLGPGLSIPRSFFEGLLELDLIEADVTDEIKIPVWSQLIGLDLKNNNFHRKWFSFWEMKFFNSNSSEVSTNTIWQELKKKNGRRAFHPYCSDISANKLFEIYRQCIDENGTYEPTKSKEAKTIFPNKFIYKIHCKLFELHGKARQKLILNFGFSLLIGTF